MYAKTQSLAASAHEKRNSAWNGRKAAEFSSGVKSTRTGPLHPSDNQQDRPMALPHWREKNRPPGNWLEPGGRSTCDTGRNQWPPATSPPSDTLALIETASGLFTAYARAATSGADFARSWILTRHWRARLFPPRASARITIRYAPTARPAPFRAPAGCCRRPSGSSTTRPCSAQNVADGRHIRSRNANVSSARGGHSGRTGSRRSTGVASIDYLPSKK
jgi:hypothetical protein